MLGASTVTKLQSSSGNRKLQQGRRCALSREYWKECSNQTCHMVRIVRIQYGFWPFFEMIRPYQVVIRISGNLWGGGEL